MSTEKIIGKVSATEKNPSTTDEFYFWTDKGEILSPFDIIKVKHLPNDTTITYGVVEEINHVTDAPSHFTSYISSDFGDTNETVGNMNRLGMNYVKARVICNTGNIYSPVIDGKQVSLCSIEDISIALGLKDVKNPITCGYLQMYKGKESLKIKVELNANFLIGPEGAHLNVSGISGLAAKTSYSMFLLNAIQQKYNAEAEKNNSSSDVAFVFFNVKGRDLLAIDESNVDLREEDKKIYADLGLTTAPFKNVKYYYPYDNLRSENVLTNADPKDVKRQRAAGNAFTYKFPCENYIDKLDLLLANEDDSTGTMESCVNYIINKNGKFNANIENWDTLIDTISEYANGSSTGQKNEILPSSWKKFLRLIKKAVDVQGVFAPNLNEDKRECDLTKVIHNNLIGGQVMCIDITLLDDNTQSFVFGSVARAIWEMKFDTERNNIPKKVIIFVDELNKYASEDTPKGSPILHQLLDITERGRSLGIILFSVEQFRSSIHKRVKGNCATSAYGRTNAIEVATADYRYIPKVYQNMMTRLPAGEYIISNPALRSLVNVKFPYNTYKQFPNG
ncbi:MAG: ATP-binding protein [Paludibacteraceae bacterium]|nr:ATP-binding protein [Paludibacteraceae bacterium]